MDRIVNALPRMKCSHTDHPYLPDVSSSCSPEISISNRETARHRLQIRSFLIVFISFGVIISLFADAKLQHDRLEGNETNGGKLVLFKVFTEIRRVTPDVLLEQF